ncbi:MAG TPA: peptide chain release factor 1 [Mollicutes bacterium]|nr:peptide chain release factor 1 [Mollicutes bacterium]
MIERLENITKKYEELEKQLMSPEIINDIKAATAISKEKVLLEDIVIAYEKYKKILVQIDETKELVSDSELGLMAKEELESLQMQKEKLEEEIEILLIPKDENDTKNVIIEIRGAAGGAEANIFAGDLYEMYTRYAANLGFKTELISSMPGEAGGFSQIEFMVKGNNVYSKFKYESGAHRVQRVPSTESQGRVHTSTATVAVIPEQKNVDIEIKESDLKVDVYRSSGAGGQSVNTTDSAIRITHIPTGIVVTCQNERSQIKNREKALQILKNKIYEENAKKKEEEEGALRRSKIGTGDRSEKIRTYNYPQNRITDHRINLTVMQLDRIMLGKLEEIIEPLITEDLKRKLAGE